MQHKRLRTINLRKVARPAALCISALFIIGMISVLMLTSVQGAAASGSDTSRGRTHRPSPTASPTPSPSPTPTPMPSSGPNLTPIPTAWTTADTGLINGIGGSAAVTEDTTVTYNGQPTIKIQCGASTPYPNDYEADSSWIAVTPGDHIVFSGYIELTAATVDEGLNGAVLDIDFYGNGPSGSGRICGCQSPSGDTWTVQNGWPSDWASEIVHYGTTTWAYYSINLVVQNTYEADGFGGPNSAGTVCTPTGIIPCLFIYTASTSERATAHFADTQLYINPQ